MKCPGGGFCAKLRGDAEGAEEDEVRPCCRSGPRGVKVCAAMGCCQTRTGEESGLTTESH